MEVPFYRCEKFPGGRLLVRAAIGAPIDIPNGALVDIERKHRRAVFLLPPTLNQHESAESLLAAYRYWKRTRKKRVDDCRP